MLKEIFKKDKKSKKGKEKKKSGKSDEVTALFKIDYPEDFIKRVKHEYPNIPELHQKLDEGSVWVGLMLQKEISISMRPSDIVKTFKEGHADEIKKTAEQAIRREALYKEWDGLYNNSIHSTFKF